MKKKEISLPFYCIFLLKKNDDEAPPPTTFSSSWKNIKKTTSREVQVTLNVVYAAIKAMIRRRPAGRLSAAWHMTWSSFPSFLFTFRRRRRSCCRWNNKISRRELRAGSCMRLCNWIRKDNGTRWPTARGLDKGGSCGIWPGGPPPPPLSPSRLRYLFQAKVKLKGKRGRYEQQWRDPSSPSGEVFYCGGNGPLGWNFWRSDSNAPPPLAPSLPFPHVHLYR